MVDGTTNSTKVEVLAGVVGENTAAVGGGIYATGNFAQVIVGNSATVSDNTATNNGGALALFVGAKAEVIGNAFLTGNTAVNYGGGAYVSDAGSTLVLDDNAALTYNEAQFGGAVAVTTSGTFTMEDGTLSHNSSLNNGGAVYVTAATFNMNGGEIRTNDAVNNGGGVYVAADSSSLFVMDGGVIGGVDDDENVAANTAVLGGGVYIAGGKATLTSGEIKGNTASDHGAGVYFSAGTLEIKGSPKIYDNYIDENASNLYLYNGKLVTVIGVLTDGAKIGVSGTGQVTTGYTSSGNGESQKNYFFGDIAGTFVAVVSGEIVIDISLENAWNAAVQESLDRFANGQDAKVQFILAEAWTAEGGAFGDPSGVGFTDNGGLLVPANAYIVINLNGYTINRNLGSAIANGSVFTISGTLETTGIAGYISGGNSTGEGGGIYVADGGVLNLTNSTIQNNEANGGAGVYVADGGTFNMTGGTITSKD